MSIIEPLLPKKETAEQKQEEHSSDPLDSLQKSVEKSSSLVEPLLSQKETVEQKLEEYSSDPLDNLQKSIEKLSFEHESFEFDSSSDMGSYINEEEWHHYHIEFAGSGIESIATYENKLIVGRIDGIIKIYDLEAKKEITLKGHSQFVSCLKVYQAKYLISASWDKTIIIWDLEIYTQERVLEWENEVFCLEATVGKILFTGTHRKDTIRKWSFDGSTDFEDFSNNSEGTTFMKVSPNNKILVTIHKDKSIIIWNIEDCQVLAKLLGHKYDIINIAISEDSNYIATGSLFNELFIWDANTRQEFRKIESNSLGTTVLGFVSGTQLVLDSEMDGKVITYDIDNKKLSELKDRVTSLAVSSQNNLVYYGQRNRSIVIFDLKSMDPITVLKGTDSKIIKMIVTGQDHYLACILPKGKIKIYAINKEKQDDKDCIISFKSDVNGLHLTKDGKYAVLNDSHEIKVWSFIEGKFVFSSHKDHTIIEISYDDTYFAFSDDNENTIHAYFFQDMKLVTLFKPDDFQISGYFSISRDKQFITSRSKEFKIKIFDTEKKSIIATLEKEKNGILEFLINKTNNEDIITLDAINNIDFWSLSEQKIIHSFHIDKFKKIWKMIESVNRLLIIMDNSIDVWSIAEKRKIATIEEHQSPIPILEISEDERLFIFYQGEEIKLWDLQQLKEIETIKNYDNYSIVSIDLSRDNKYIAILYSNKYVKIWNCEEKKFIAILQLPQDNWKKTKFSGDAKFIVAQSADSIAFRYIENYLCKSILGSYAYFIPGLHDKIFRHKFVNWIKKPTKELWDKRFIDIIVYPIGYNLLHLLCIADSVDMLSLALKDGAIIFRDQQNMSPLSYALIKSSRRCIDQILNYVIDLEDDYKLFHCIYQLRDDVPLLFSSKSQSLIPFLEVLFRRRADKDLIGFYEVTEELPMTIFSPIYKIFACAFTGENTDAKESSKQNTNLVQFWGSPLGYNYTAGSDESLLLIKKMDECNNPEIFQTLYVQSLIREKWDYLWPAIITISIIYWLNLATMIWYIFDPSIYVLSTFIVLNGILALYELLQVITEPADYVSEIWNFIDFLRLVLSITWAIFEIYEENVEGLAFAVVLVNFFRGLTYFRAFDFTRFYVRLILMALSDSVAFLVIFLYSTLAFGILYASLNSGLSISDVWVMAYELNMGNFENNGFSFIQYSCFTLASLINVVMMLNLLVSTLGDTFDRFQMIADELNSKEMLQLVIEFESIMFWRRSELAKLNSKGKLMYLQRCDIFQDSNVSDKWQGKIKEISTKIDGYKDVILDMKKNMNEEFKNIGENAEKSQISLNDKIQNIGGNVNEKMQKLEEKIDSLNPKMSEMESKMEFLRQDWESKMNRIMEMLEEIKQK